MLRSVCSTDFHAVLVPIVHSVAVLERWGLHRLAPTSVRKLPKRRFRAVDPAPLGNQHPNQDLLVRADEVIE